MSFQTVLLVDSCADFSWFSLGAVNDNYPSRVSRSFVRFQNIFPPG